MKFFKKITHKKNFYALSVLILMSITTILKLILIINYTGSLSVYSDDINYYISSVYFLKSGVLTYRTFNEATVFIMPLYPLFLSGILKIFGIGFAGLQAVRVIQVSLSTICILIVYLIGKKLFNRKAGLISATIFSFYPPNLVTPGYILTESLFSFLLVMLLYLSFKYSDNLSFTKICMIGVVWILAVFCRPTILFYPGLYLVYLFINKHQKIYGCIKYGLILTLIFVLAALPWWGRNYNEYGKFIPLTASSGNPLLQGTYINYLQTPENTTGYKVGKTALETDNVELNVAYERIRSGFKNDFFKYLCWYTVGKTFYFWVSPFYWSYVFGIGLGIAYIYHIFIMTSAALGTYKIIKERLFLENCLIFFVSFYFNIIHCIYMSFDRYAYPIIGIICIYSGSAFILSKDKK